MRTSSSDVADEEQFLFTLVDGDNETETHTLERKAQSRNKVTDLVANEEKSSIKSSIKEVTKIPGNTMSHSMNRIKANEPMRVEQDVNLILNPI